MSQTCPHFLQRFTVRGQCAECAPTIHADWDARCDAAYAVFDRYRQETGREPLDDWYAFEAWVDANRGVMT